MSGFLATVMATNQSDQTKEVNSYVESSLESVSQDERLMFSGGLEILAVFLGIAVAFIGLLYLIFEIYLFVTFQFNSKEY